MSQPQISQQQKRALFNGFSLIKDYGWEALFLIAIFVVFLLFNINTYLVYPIVAHDEVMFTDPAANLYFGNGFTSTAWEFQTKDEFWAGNAPLYSILLAAWMHLFGFSVLAARSLNYVLTIISAIAIWLAVIRLNLVTSSIRRVGLIGILLLSDAVFFSYRTGRYDSTTILVCAAALLAFSVTHPWLRCTLLACIAIFLPMAGLHLAAFSVIFCSLLLFYLRRSFVRECVSIAIGAIMGVIFMLTLYFTNGVLKGFIISTMGAHHSFTGKLGQALVLHKTKHIAEYKDVLLVFFREYSFPILLALAIGMAIYQYRKGKLKFRSPLSFGLATSFCVPVGVFFLGKYPIYYVWMALIPLLICIFATFDEWKFNSKNGLHWMIVVALVLTCLMGLPRRLAAAASIGESIDYPAVETLVENNVTKDDWVLSDYSAYYAAKKIGATVILPNYTESSLFPSIPEKEKITVMVINPNTLEKVLTRVGGKWDNTGKGIRSRMEDYTLQVYRRSTAP